MAQMGFSIIAPYYSATPGAVPLLGNLIAGEIAINVNDRRMFVRNTMSAVVELGTNPSSLTTGSANITALTASSATIASLTTSNATITGGSINNTPIGATTRAAGSFTDLAATNNVTATGASHNFGNGAGAASVQYTTLSLSAGNGVAVIGVNATGFASATLTSNNSGTTNSGVPTGTVGIGTGSNVPFVFTQNGAEVARITTTRSLGVGTTSPQSVIHAAQDTSTGADLLSAENLSTANNTTKFAGIKFLGRDTVNTQKNVGFIRVLPNDVDFVGSNMVFFTRNGDAMAERARITAGGYFKASNTGSYGNVAGLGDLLNTPAHIFQTDNQEPPVYFVTSNTTGDASRTYLPSGSAGFHVRSQLNAVTVYQVLANGNVQNTNNSYGAISDAKLKENITPASPKLEKLAQVEIVNYNLIGSELKQIGVVAQQLEAIFPGMIEESPDLADVEKTREVEVPEVLGEDGEVLTPASTRTETYTEKEPTGTFTKSVKYSVFVPMLIKALQEERTARMALETRLSLLESRMPA